MTNVFMAVLILIAVLLFLVYLKIGKLFDEVSGGRQIADTGSTISDFLESDIAPRLRKFEDGVKGLASES